MIPFLVIRHGKTQWNLDKKLQGRRDIPLCDAGKTELSKYRIPTEFDDFDWRVSPLLRARQTAELLGCRSDVVDDRLIEMNFGEWEGMKLSQLRDEYGDALLVNEAKGVHMKPPGGESPYEVQQRLKSFLKGLTKPTIAITHKGVIRALKSLACNWDMKQKSPITFDWSTAHLFLVDELGQPHLSRANIRLDQGQ